jgi:hypothetical protein
MYFTHYRSSAHRRSARRANFLKLAPCVAAAMLICTAPAHAAGWLDSLFGSGASRTQDTASSKNQRTWRIREFSGIELVPREPGSSENQQPASGVNTNALKQRLAAIQYTVSGTPRALFAEDEAADIAQPLAQALGRAGPGDDILLLSSSRRDGGILSSPKAVTARIFVQGGNLQLIVHDARNDFYDNYRGTYQPPKFGYGSRKDVGTAVLSSTDGATVQRADWLSIPISTLIAPVAGAAPAAVQAAPVMAAPAPAAAQPAPAPLPPPAAAAPPPRQPLDAAGSQDIERRLETLKRLREKNLITEEEYQQKRKEILQLL